MIAYLSTYANGNTHARMLCTNWHAHIVALLVIVEFCLGSAAGHAANHVLVGYCNARGSVSHIREGILHLQWLVCLHDEDQGASAGGDPSMRLSCELPHPIGTLYSSGFRSASLSLLQFACVLRL